MRLLYPAAGAVALLLTAPGLGLAAERTYDLPPFTSIDISSGITAEVAVGASQRVVASSGNQREIDELKVKVEDGTLKLWRDFDITDLFKGPASTDIRVTIAVPVLTSAVASAGAELDISSMTGDALSLEASSGSDIEVSGIRAVAIRVEASAGADLSVNGSCNSLAIDASSGSTVDLDDLDCTEVEVNASSGSDVDLRVSGTLKANASSGANVTVQGRPATTDIEQNSGAIIDLAD